MVSLLIKSATNYCVAWWHPAIGASAAIYYLLFQVSFLYFLPIFHGSAILETENISTSRRHGRNDVWSFSQSLVWMMEKNPVSCSELAYLDISLKGASNRKAEITDLYVGSNTGTAFILIAKRYFGALISA